MYSVLRDEVSGSNYQWKIQISKLSRIAITGYFEGVFCSEEVYFPLVVFHDFVRSNRCFLTRDHKMAVVYRYVRVRCCTEEREENNCVNMKENVT